MAQTNYTPISLYYSTTASAVPTAANLVPGELAINTADGKLYYEDSAGVVQVLATKSTGSIGGSNTQVQFNNSGSLGGSSGLTWDGSFLTTSSIKNSALTSGRVTYAGASGLLTDSANLLYSGTDLTVYGLTVGRGAGAVSTNTALGASALATNSTGAQNTAIGYFAGNTTNGAYLTAVGYTAARYSTGDAITAIGNGALLNNTSGNNNTAVGYQSLNQNTTASNNTAVGYQAGYTNITGAKNVFIGQQAGKVSTGNFNTIIGNEAGLALTTGTCNTFVGGYNNTVGGSGELVTSGSKNTILGVFTGNLGGLDIRTASNYIVLSDGDGNPRGYHNGDTWVFNVTDNSGAYRIIYNAGRIYPSTDNNTSLGDGSNRWSVVYAATGTINTSDANQKQQIRDLNTAEKAVAQSIKGLIKAFKFNDAVAKKGNDARIHIGIIAQEVQAAFEAEGLDATKYAMFCSDTWYEVDGKSAQESADPFTKDTPNAVEVTRLGIRYDQLLAFVISTL
jgi:hypothetical protein